MLLDAILSNLRREPSRLWSLVITVYGDAIVPRGGSVWLGTLNAIFAPLGIGEGAVRTAMSRLAADGWLERSRAGRNSFYRLAHKGRATFAAATEHIYDPPRRRAAGRLRLLLLPPGAERDGARPALEAAGFGSPFPGLWIAPADVPLPPEAEGAIRLDASAADDDLPRLAQLSWPLERIGASYRRFGETFSPLADALDGGEHLSDLDSLLARILLIHDYRRIILRDPLLPAALLPADWPGADARDLCRALYPALLGPSERWLDAHGKTESGPLPPAGPELRNRFR